MDCKKYFGFFDEEHPEPYVIKSGTLPIIISAPHTYRHFREGRVKAAERGAGVIAMALGDMKGTHWMVKAREDGDDPNYSADSPYKKALAAYMTGKADGAKKCSKTAVFGAFAGFLCANFRKFSKVCA